MAGYKVIESNDTGKTDHKDPRVMHLLARTGKVLTHRLLPECYRRLRRLVAYYEDDEAVLAATRQRIQGVIGDLFPDGACPDAVGDKSATFTFDSTGAALAEAYQFNCYRIARGGYVRFRRVMKRRVRGVRLATLEHLFSRAEESAKYQKSKGEVAVLTSHLQALWADYERLTERRAALRAEIEALGAELKEVGDLPAVDHLKGLSLFNLARVLGETGPLGDFRSKRALLYIISGHEPVARASLRCRCSRAGPIGYDVEPH